MAKKRSRFRRRALVLTGIATAGTLGLWTAIHEVPWLGPALADCVRSVVGPAPVAWAEDVAYGVADAINRVRYRGSKPKTFWETPPSAKSGPAPAAAAAPPDAPAPPQASSDGTRPAVAQAGDAAESEPGFPPPPFAPPHVNVAAEGDGVWVPMSEAAGAGEAPVLYKTVVHPDPKRTFTAVAIVAIDFRRLDLHLVAGTAEPQSQRVPRERRPGRIPDPHVDDLVAAFNGGFKAMHGHYGMRIGDDAFLPPRDIACTIGFLRDGSMRIGTWTALAPIDPQMVAYRQTPPCLVENGAVHTALGEWGEYNRNWGAAVGGETIIRRSAIGITKDGRTLFYALGEAVTARALAHAMLAAGADSAAQLDVNYSYPRFLVYQRPGPAARPRATTSLIPGIKFAAWEYLDEPSHRDFFYLVRRRRSS